MEAPFPPFDPDGEAETKDLAANSKVRLRDIPLRVIVPNVITLLAICAGLSSIRFAIEGQVNFAVLAILIAGILDAMDGRVARTLNATSRFGEQMDSLADFVNFGVAPALLVYFTVLQGATPFGWITALIFASCACLRLARFNVMLGANDESDWHKRYFLGVPAPAGAIIVLLPVYIELNGHTLTQAQAAIATAHVLLCGFLLVSNLPTFSGKQLGPRIRRDLVMPIMITAVIMAAFLVTYPWPFLTFVAVTYLASLPFSYYLSGSEETPSVADEDN